MTLTWANGRQLSTLTKSGKTTSHEYDINGNRTKKVAGGATTEYYLNEGTIVAEKKGSELIRYLFDENGNRFGLEWKGTKYYYVFNGQGDVIGITDPRNRLAVSYTYDAWGKLLSTGGDNPALAAANPIRYRGYYYDTETGLYYIQRRYYDPEVGRWISPEPNVDVGEFDVGAGLIGYNVYGYCANNPINMIDITGEFVTSITAYFFGAVIVTACVAMVVVVNTPSFQRSWERMCNGIAGAFSGALAWAAAQAKSIAQSIGDSFSRARSKPHYRTPREVHHIVAQAAPNASRARQVLNSVGISVNSPQNLISIKTGLHRRLHTNTYYGWANSVIISAYNKGRNRNEKRRNVEAALASIRTMIMAMDKVAPY